MIARIDQWLTEFASQKLIDGDRVRDMLLDMRLMAADIEKEVAWLQHSTVTPVN